MPALNSSSEAKHEIEVSLRREPQYQAMVLCVLAMAGGIALDRFFDCDWRCYLAVVIASLIGWRIRRIHPDRVCHTTSLLKRESLASTLLLVALVGLGAFWHHGRWNWFGQHEIGTFAQSVATPCCLDAIVISEPRLSAPSHPTGGLDYSEDTSRTRVAILAKRIRDGDQWIPVSGCIDLVIHVPTRHIAPGDEIRIFGRLVGIDPPSNPGQFDFGGFYRAKGKLASIHSYQAESVVVTQSANWGGARLLSPLRHRLNQITWKYIDTDEAAFASAILLGNREQLSTDRRDLFLQTGTVHLLAISGLHVGILAGSFFLFFRLGVFNRRNCLIATILFVVFYAWLVEFRPPVSRAAILIVLYCVARLLGESSFSYNLLAIAGLIVLLINPTDLFGIGPQLSFLAVATLTFGKDWVFWPPSTDPIKRLIATTRPFHVRTYNWLGRQLRTAFLVSGLIWFVAMPLVAFRFNLVAPIALLVNPLLLVPIAWALYGGLGVLVFGWFLPPVAKICGKFCEWNLSLVEWMIGIAQSFPLSHFWTSGPTLYALIAFYVGLFFIAIFPPTRLRLKWIATLFAVWLVFAWLIPDQIATIKKRSQPSSLKCTFIDVGHGTSVLIQLPNGQNMLYDAGSFGSSNYGFRNIAGVLWHERIEHLDAVVLSHADIDHFNSLPGLVRRFSIGVVYVSPQMLESESEAVKTILDQLSEFKIPVKTTVAGDRLSAGAETEISVLNPPFFGTGGNDNSNSIVLMIETANRKIMLPGDLESAGLDLLLQSTPVDCDLLMAAHHGSINSRPQDFVAWATPETIAISGGSQRVKDSVAVMYGGENRKVFRTDRNGAIRYVIAADGEIEVMHWVENHWQSE